MQALETPRLSCSYAPSSRWVVARTLRALTAALLVGLLGLVASPVRARGVDEVQNPRQSHAGWVTDEPGLLGSDAAYIEERLEALHQQIGAEVAWVILRSIGDRDPREFGTELLHHWGVGRKEQDDGVLVLHVLDRRRIEIVTGYGAEAALPDIKCAWLLREIAVPAFRDGQLARGHLALSRGIDRALRSPDISHADLIAAALENEVERAGPPPRAAKLHIKINMASKATQRWIGLLLGILAIAALIWRARVFMTLGASPSGRVYELIIPCAVFLGFILLAGSFADQSVLPSIGLFSTCLAAALAIGLYDWRKLRQRKAPRQCSSCPLQLRWLEGEQAQALLSAGARKERELRSMRFEIRRCDCGEESIKAFELESKIRRCPSCNFRTLVLSHTLTLKKATETEEGEAENLCECALCLHELRELAAIPMVTRATSSSSSNSNSSSWSSDSSSSNDSSSSDSFSGGDSGGGGAGESY